MLIKHILLITMAVAVTMTVQAQQKELTDEQFFKNSFKGITEPLPSMGQWIDDSHFVLRRSGKAYEVDAKTGAEKEYTEPAVNKGSVAVKPIVVVKGNDLYERKNADDVRLTNDDAKEVNPVVSPDGIFVAYTKNNDLYAMELATKKELRLTTDGSDVILNGYASWVYMEEILGRASQYRSFWWSPDSKTIAFFRADDTPVPVFTITDATGQHGTVEKQRYPKGGDPNPEIKVGMVQPQGGAITWADFNAKTDQYFGMPWWRPDGKALWVQWMNRGQDNLVIYEVNPANGSKKEIYNETQKTWVELDDNDRVRFLESGKGCLLTSDKTGWNHIYYLDMNGKEINPVTSGRFTVLSIDRVDEKGGFVYFTTRSRENSARRDFYRVRLNGKDLVRLTFGDFNHQVNLSPGGSYLVTTYSNSTTPTAIALVDAKKGKLVKELGSAKGAEFDSYKLAKTEVVRVKSDDGLYDLPMKVTWPTNMEPGKKYPVLISIYGGPNAGTVWDTWSLNGQQQFYAKEGLIQVAMDHRASGHFGKEGVNYMHRNLGYWETTDYSTLAKWLIANGQADAGKICITGFSYGGYMSCYALTFGANVFTHGMAGGSVTDWALYDSHYTERFMDTPNENPDGYKSASVLTHADKYKGVLQLVHGGIDDNVHLQNTIQFAGKLQDLKKDFELMYYSGNRHGIGGPKGIHFQNLKTKFIYKYLLEKPVPKEALR